MSDDWLPYRAPDMFPGMVPKPRKGKPGRPRFRLSAPRRALIEEWRPGMSNRDVHARGVALGVWPDDDPDPDMLRKRVARIRKAALLVYDPPE